MAQKIRKRFAGMYDILEILINPIKNHVTLELIRYYNRGNISALAQEIEEFIATEYPEINFVRIYFDDGKYTQLEEHNIEIYHFDNQVALAKVPLAYLPRFLSDNLVHLVTYNKLNKLLITEVKIKLAEKSKQEDSDGWITVTSTKSPHKVKKNIIEYIKKDLI